MTLNPYRPGDRVAVMVQAGRDRVTVFGTVVPHRFERYSVVQLDNGIRAEYRNANVTTIAQPTDDRAQHPDGVGLACRHCDVPIVLNYDGRGTRPGHLYGGLLEGYEQCHAVREARATTEARARRHFLAGGEVLVGITSSDTCTVTPTTVTHRGDAAAWSELVATVASYGDPRQRFFIVADPRDRVPA